MASKTSCCKSELNAADGTQTVVIKKCVLKTAEGDVECECVCKCKKAATSNCESCVCDCKCTPETAQRIETAEGVKYRCECTCSC